MKLLAIKLDQIGDFALAVPALWAAHKAGAQVDVVVQAGNLGWKEILPWVNRWYVADVPSPVSKPYTFYLLGAMFRNAIKLGLRLPFQEYDMAVDLRMYDGDVMGRWIAALSGAQVRAGGGGWGRSLLTLETVSTRQHEEERIWERLNQVIPLSPLESTPLTAINHPVPSAREPRILMCMGSFAPSKCWPLAHWIQLAKMLSETSRSDTRLVFVGGPGDKNLVENILSKLDHPSISNCYPADLYTFLQLIADSDLVVGLDSSPQHMARLVATPVVTIYAGTSPSQRWGAKGDNLILQTSVPCSPCYKRECLYADHPCMTGITPERVFEAIVQRLKIVRPDALLSGKS
jgi:ADP-heptose:LPS heptosyltransferase